MSCTKFADFDKENGNYPILVRAIEDGRILLHEDKCLALIDARPLRVGFIGLSAYLKTLGYKSYIEFDHTAQDESGQNS
jgi:hypothetical protein